MKRECKVKVGEVADTVRGGIDYWIIKRGDIFDSTWRLRMGCKIVSTGSELAMGIWEVGEHIPSAAFSKHNTLAISGKKA